MIHPLRCLASKTPSCLVNVILQNRETQVIFPDSSKPRNGKYTVRVKTRISLRQQLKFVKSTEYAKVLSRTLRIIFPS